MKQRVTVFGWAMLFVTLLVSCLKSETEGTMPATIGMEGIEWQLVEVSGIPVSTLAGARRPFVQFDAAKQEATGFTGCNNFFGKYERDGSSLKFGPVGSTRMACPDLQMSLETEVFKALDKTKEWKITDGELLLLDDSEVLARFTMEQENEPAMDVAPRITGTVWQWAQTLYNDDRKAVPAYPENYTLQFREDGTLNVKADCNLKGGAYSTDGKLISIEITHSTMAACPEDSLEDEFVRNLTAAAIFFFKDNDLYLDLKYDTGMMQFLKK